MTQRTVTPRRLSGPALVACLALALGAFGVAVKGYCSVASCTFFAEDFEPYGAKASAAREVAGASVADLAQRGSTGGEVLASGTRDGCRTGQHDWMLQETYSHSCQVQASRLVVLTTDRSQVPRWLTTTDQTLRRSGCAPRPWGGLERLRDEFWLAQDEPVRQDGALALPPVTYDCAAGTRVDIVPGTARGFARPLEGLAVSGSRIDDVLAEDWYGTEDEHALGESHAELALVVTAIKTYYRTRY